MLLSSSLRRAVVAALATLVAACGSDKPAAIKTASSPKTPAWMTRATSDSQTLYFSGAKEGSSSLEDGKAAALEAAKSQAAQFIGTEISAEHSDVMSTEEAENKAKDTVKSRATAMVRSAEVADVYWEKLSRPEYDRFDVWVLIKRPRGEIGKGRDRQQQEAKETVVAALGRYREGLAQEKQGDPLAALLRYRDVLSQLKGQGQNVDTGDKDIATAGRLKQLAGDAAASAQAKVRRAIVLAP